MLKYSDIACLPELAGEARRYFNQVPFHVILSHYNQFWIFWNLIHSLRLPDLSKDFSFTDAWTIVLSRNLCRLYDCEFLTSTNVSRELTAVEQRWIISEIEKLAFVWSVQILSKFLLGKLFFWPALIIIGLQLLPQVMCPKTSASSDGLLSCSNFLRNILPVPAGQNVIAD